MDDDLTAYYHDLIESILNNDSAQFNLSLAMIKRLTLPLEDPKSYEPESYDHTSYVEPEEQLKQVINNINNKNKLSPLLLAVSCGRIEMMVALLEAGADPYMPNKSGTTVLDLSEQYGFKDISFYLRSRYPGLATMGKSIAQKEITVKRSSDGILKWQKSESIPNPNSSQSDQLNSATSKESTSDPAPKRQKK